MRDNCLGSPKGGLAVMEGFTDIHCHGGGGFSFSDPNPDHIAIAIATHREHGTTTQIASLVTEPLERLHLQIRNLLPFVDDGSLAGIHLEGPYLSRAKCGAHDPKLLRAPRLDEIRELIEMGEGHIKMMTIAPELPNALDSIRFLIDMNVTVALGHSNASEEVAIRAIDAGATVVTHMFNGMPTFDHRSGTITNAVLLNSHINFEIILDGVHVNHSAVELLLKLAPDRIILITDAMSAAGGDDGSYTMGDLAVTVSGGVARLVSNDSLAGSTLTMDAAYNRLISEHHVSAAVARSAAIDLGKRTLRI